MSIDRAMLSMTTDRRTSAYGQGAQMRSLPRIDRMAK
jgi:hypothetical protein